MRELLRAGPWAWLLAVRMGWWRLVLPVAKHTLSLDRLVRLMSSPRDIPRRPDREALAVRVAGRLWRSSQRPCLERSLALYRELGRLGASPELLLGMARDGEGMVGHAWVEVDGVALLEPRSMPGAVPAPVVRYPR